MCVCVCVCVCGCVCGCVTLCVCDRVLKTLCQGCILDCVQFALAEQDVHMRGERFSKSSCCCRWHSRFFCCKCTEEFADVSNLIST